MKARFPQTPGAVILVLWISGVLQAQWSSGPSGAIYYNGGNVGIGTATPSSPLQIHASQSVETPSPMMNVVSDNAEYSQLQIESFSGSAVNYGAVLTGVSGHGTSASPSATQSNEGLLVLEAAGYTPAGMQSIGGYLLISAENNWTNSSTPTFMEFRTNPSGTSNNPITAMHISGSGNVGIGTKSPQHLLQVAGIIGAEQVIVSSTGADYVFDPHYHLAPLSEVAAFVEQNHHLPGIPSADEMSKSGVSIGEMQAKLLAKIEELTLHMIQAEERNTRLEEQNRELNQHDRELIDRDAKRQSRIAALEAHAQDSIKRRNKQ